jgi:hypothetical protein
MYNGGRPWAARQAQWKLFRELGANGVVIPTDTLPEPPVQLGGEVTGTPTWWTAGAADTDSVVSDPADTLPEAESVVAPAPVAATADSVALAR